MLGEYDSGYENYIDSLIRETEKLQDENDKLSEQVSSLVGRSFRTADKMSCIEAENAKLRQQLADVTESMGRVEGRCAKLRELVQQMYPKAKAFLQMGVQLGCNDTLSYDWYLQLRDLGVEVDV